jgi:hypothetical protein
MGIERIAIFNAKVVALSATARLGAILTLSEGHSAWRSSRL